ncbi:MAG: glutamate symporter [Gemmatimonadota bacterium]
MAQASAGPRRRLGLGTQILLGMVGGALLGALVGERVEVVEPLGTLFIRLLMMAAVPLVFFNLLAGLTSLTDLRTLGRLAGKTAAWFAVTTAAAVLLGMTAMILARPGVGMTPTGAVDRDPGAVPSLVDLLLGLVPTNAFAAFADGDVAQVVVMGVLLGAATLLLPDGPRDRLRELYADLAALLRKLVDLILLVAPYGIGALMAVAAGRYGALLFGPMARFVLVVWGAHAVVVLGYMATLRAASPWRPLAFLKRTWSVWATTLATTSSLASLSVSLEVAEEMELPRPLYGFVLPLGAQVNKDGTAVFLAAVTLFTAQAAGVTPAFGELVTVFLMAFLLSAGSGGIPGGGFVVALLMVQALQLPLEMAAIVGGIYRLVDMGNTTVNVMGDMVGTVLVAASEERRGATWS